MANTLESLSGKQKIVVHNSATDLLDKTPLQAYQGKTISNIVDAARVPKQKHTVAVDGTSVNSDNIKSDIIIIPSGFQGTTLDLPGASGGQAKLIEKLELSEVGSTFEFIVINQHNTAVTLGTVTNGTYIGHTDAATAREIGGNAVAKYLIRATSSTVVEIYRVQ
jgi:hypothetical protein